jgi:iron complex transport system substrate-binding protein
MTLKGINTLLLCGCLLMPGFSGLTMAQSISVIDDDGHSVSLAQPARRIISLAPSMTELLFSLGAGDRVVGVMDFSDYPPEARERPIVGRFDMLDMERILALQPDLIVAWRSGNPRNSIQRLKELGFSVYIAEPDSLTSIAGHLSRLGRLTGQDDEADILREYFESELLKLQSSYNDRTPVTVFYQVWHSPIISVGGAELINDMIGLCGGRNIFAGLPVGPKVNLEDVLVRDPQIIVASGSNDDSPEWLNDWLRWPQLQAVKNKHLYSIAPDLVQRHSLRALQGAGIMCEHIDQVRR